jgi:hypothetical protein
MASLAGGVIAAHADTFRQRAASTQDLSQTTGPASWPSIAPTVCPESTDTICKVTLDAGTGSVAVRDVNNDRTAADGTVTAGSTTLISPTLAFTGSDVGTTIVVTGAGVAGADLVTTISSFTDASTVVLADPAGADIAGTAKVEILQRIPIFGFDVNHKGQHTLAGGATSTIKVQQGTTLEITFTQTGIADPINLTFPSLPAGSVTSDGNVYTVHVGDTVGTSVFQPGTNADAPKQIAMGLVGVLIVTPSGCTAPNRMCAYDTTPYADEALVATTDLDPQFADDPSSFDMSYFGQARTAEDTPRRVYHAINGKSFPDTDVIDARPTDNVLLRYVNAGVSDKSMGLLGLRQDLLARNTSTFRPSQSLIAPLIGPGETADVSVTIPLGAPAGQRYALMDQSRQMNHGNGSGFGGALTFLNVWAYNTSAVDVLTFDFTTGALEIKGHSMSGLTIDGYQIVTAASGVVPVWPGAKTDLDPAAAAPSITTTLTPDSTKLVWVRLHDSSNTWTVAKSVEMVAPTVADLSFADGTFTASGHSSGPANLITGFQTAVTDTSGLPDPGTGWSVTHSLATPSSTVTLPPTSLTPGAGQYVWVRVQQDLAVFSAPVSLHVVAPTVGTLTFTAPDQLAIAASSTMSSVVAAEVSTGGAAAATGSGDSIGTAGSFGHPSYADTVTLASPPADGSKLWVRVQDANGIWSDAVSVDVVVRPTLSLGWTPGGDLALTAAVSNGATVIGVEYSWSADGVTAPATPLAISAGFADTIVVGPAPSGSTTIWVRVIDSAGHWSIVTSLPIPAP